MRSRAIERAKGLLALVAVVATLAGPPVALVAFVGNPMPAAIPSWQEIGDGITRGGISDRTVIDVLAVLAWVIWAQLAAALVAETVAVARGRKASRLRGLLPGMQPLAARWLAAVALVLTPLVAPPPAAATRPAPLAVPAPDNARVADAEPAPPAPLVGDGSAADTSGRSARPQLVEYVVRRHDSYWAIAERFIGDPLRWREIRDLNIGRLQPGGETIQPGSDLIRPGWRLLVPAAEAGAATASTASAPGQRTVGPGDDFWEIAEEAVTAHLGRTASDAEVRPYWQALIEANRDILTDPANPSLIFAGQVLEVPAFSPPAGPQPAPPPAAAANPPAAPAPPDLPGDGSEPAPGAPEVRSTPTSETPSPAREPERGASAAPTPAGDEDDDDAGTTVPPGLLGVAGAGLAVGIAAAVRLRRRQQSARAPAGFAPPPIPSELDPLRAEVGLAADADARDDLTRALASIGAHVSATRAMNRRRLRLAQVLPDRVEVLLDEPALPAPPGWEPEASGAIWWCARPVPDASDTVACPTLVTVGSEDGNDVLLDLESAGVVTIGSDDPAGADALLRSIVLELEHSASSDYVALVVVGDVDHLDSDRVRRADRWEEVADDALAWARQSQQALAANRFATAFEARGSGRHIDGTAPLVVVCTSVPEAETFETFCALAHEGAAACAVVVGEPLLRGGTHIRIDGDSLSIPDLGFACRAQGIAAEAVGEVGDLLAAAEQAPQPLTLFGENDVIDLEPAPNGYRDPSWDVLVRVLGEIRVVGGHTPLRPKQTALFAFVALHGPCSVDRIEEAIWPTPMDSRRRQVHNTVSRIRTALGADHLPAAADSEYRVGPHVRTDLDLLRRRAAYAATQSPEQAIETLRGALELVEGPAFTYRNADRGAFVWVDLEHWTSETEARVVEITWRLWHLCSDRGDTEGAIWAARQGLVASPGNTDLTDALMRAYLAAGDRYAAEEVFMSHAKALDELDQEDPAPSTLELWEDLREGREPSRP